jgi:hypothetical protein
MTPSLRDYLHVYHTPDLASTPPLEKLSFKGFREGREDACDSPRQSVFFDYISYFHGRIWRTSHRIIWGFQQWLAHLSPSWLVSKAISLSRHLAKQRFNTWHKLTTVWKTSWSLSHLHTHDNPTTSNITYDDIKKASLAKE